MAFRLRGWDTGNRLFPLMIAYVTGALGVGKTFHSSRMYYEHLARGGTVVTNVEGYPEIIRNRIARQFKVWIEDDQLRRFDPETDPDWHLSIPWGKLEGDVLVVLDETHLFYNARDWAETAKAARDLLRFLTQSRKAGVDVLWITQDGGNVDKQFRVLAEWELGIVSTAHLALGWLGKLPFKAYCVKWISAKQQIVIKKEWFLYNSWIKGTYKTQAMVDGFMKDLETRATRLGRRKLRRVGFFERQKLELVAAVEPLRNFYQKHFKKCASS